MLFPKLSRLIVAETKFETEKKVFIKLDLIRFLITMSVKIDRN